MKSARTPTDTELLDGLRAGRTDAFERLYAEYRSPLYNLCARILGDRDEAQDVTQEVFAAAFERLPGSPGSPLHLRAWLYRVATNACLNRLRTSRRVVGDGGRLDVVADGVDEYQRAQTAALVEASLAALNERYRTALVLKDLHGLPPAEIAEVMEVSRPTADVLVHRARSSFRAAFTRLGGTSPAPASLALVLVPLGPPAALLAVPPLPLAPVTAPALPASAAPTPPVSAALPPPVPFAPVSPDLSPLAGPAGVGLLAKIGAALTTKAAVGAAAVIIVGGGAVAVREAGPDGSRLPVAGAATATAATTATAPRAALHDAGHSGHGHGRWGHGAPEEAHGTGHSGGPGADRHASGHDGSAGHDGMEPRVSPAAHDEPAADTSHSAGGTRTPAVMQAGDDSGTSGDHGDAMSTAGDGEDGMTTPATTTAA